jgi:hypothetical protein
MTDKIPVTEHIVFHKDGSSTHTWTFPDGSTREEFFQVAPVFFLRHGFWPPTPPPPDLRSITRVFTKP